jgi:hypothetical protein
VTQTIIECLDDPHLFSGLMDKPSWTPWRVLLKAVYGLPLDDTELTIYQRHTGRQIAPQKQSRYAEMVVGRRGGKSRTLAIMAIYQACVPDHSPYLVPGEVPVIAIIAKDREQADVILNYIGGTLRASDMFADMIKSQIADTIELTNGVRIEIFTASIGAPRGRTFLAVLADETAFWPSGDSANPDAEVINAVRPGLTTIPYSLLLIASSPYAKRGLLYQNYARYFGRDDAPVLVWQGTTEEMNTDLVGDPLIAEMYEEDPERASAEYGARFRSDIVAFITREAVEDCLARDVRELAPMAGVTYVGHVDPSGGSADSFTLAVAHLDTNGLAVLDAIREVKPPFSPDAVVMEFALLLKSYGISRVTGDAYAGLWPRERFAVHGITYDLSSRNTSAIYLEFLPALNAKRVQLLDLPRLVGQLVGLERRTARGGRDSIAHAPGSHDDVANVACGALVQVIEDRRPALIQAADLTVAEQGVVHAFPQLYFSTLWVAVDGMCGWAIFSYSTDDNPALIVVDFDYMPWSATIPRTLALRLDECCEEARDRDVGGNMRGFSAMMHVPAQLYDITVQSMQMVFGRRFDRRDISYRKLDVIPVDPAVLGNAAGMILNASAHISGGSVKLSPLALARAEGKPLLGRLALRPGEAVETDPLRVGLLLGIAELNDNAMQTEGAPVRFG